VTVVERDGGENFVFFSLVQFYLPERGESGCGSDGRGYMHLAFVLLGWALVSGRLGLSAVRIKW
jgi:hypothetical protein